MESTKTSMMSVISLLSDKHQNSRSLNEIDDMLYSFDTQKELLFYIVVAWSTLFLIVIMLVCHYRNGCLTYDCLRDEIPNINQIRY